MGQVLGSLARASAGAFRHEFILLDEPGAESLRNIERSGLEVQPAASLAARAAAADIVQVEWWNHPLLGRLLGRTALPPCRLLVYAHISGFHHPNVITRSIVDFADRFVASTEYTLRELPLLRELSAQSGRKLSAVHSCAGLSRVEGVRKEPHEGFVAGYIGALDFGKLHPDFVKMTAAGRIPGARFPVYGRGEDAETLESQISAAGAGDRIQLRGYAADVAPAFASFDVLGYPLNPLHYGTGEQVLIEAMGAGVPAVVLGNGPEKEIIRDGYNGLVASSPEDYPRCLERLAADRALLEKLGRGAREHARANFTIEAVLRRFEALYEDLLREPRRERGLAGRRFPGASEGLEAFLNSLGGNAGAYVDSAFSADQPRVLAADRAIARENVRYTGGAKGTVFQYRKYFPDDAVLAFWSGLILLEKGERAPAAKAFAEARALGFDPPRLRGYAEDAAAV